ncbi:hypothetical protein EV361DRAFT_950702 [Lentinula raphanica]|uniref:C2H2-type domain-containing protein n=1 Tax=Lentinula raphanica TaxID=153919 RepID=A0AA38PJ78_9AGAR|nr:hypothetical protein F5880DRAFT_183124 [Lentinula raphanica]KAJ3843643.1 hypothetical protein F5878DRAFT_251201 [Lentinula raphanica]KAJ3970295.1 hypothetical protein EV361DRAFT_950702 [Lentinula raphanica]
MQTHYYTNDPDPQTLFYAQNTTTYAGSAQLQHYPVATTSHTGMTGLYGFSDGSPPTACLDHEYPYHFFDRGGTSTNGDAQSSSSSSTFPVVHLPNATGLSESGNPSSALSNEVYAEDIHPYQPAWDLPSTHGHPHARLADSAALRPDFSFKGGSYSAFAPSPNTLKVPTPSEMAILMRPNGASTNDIAPIVPPTPMNMPSEHLSAVHMSSAPPEEEFTLARERKHACSMCHKRFDRPSTLRKHLLVHTGEKAFQCETCGRRFGVASNLNRHVRRCILKPVNVIHSPPTATTGTDSSPEPAHTTPSNERSRTATANRTSNSISPGPRAPHSVSQTRPTRTPSQLASQTTCKRRRRAPSPSRWIPDSLRGFILEELHKATPVPLPPVVPSAYEERNSLDENVGVTPYHPREWARKPQLPGPGMSNYIFGGKDVGNFGGGGREMFGRVLVF